MGKKSNRVGGGICLLAVLLIIGAGCGPSLTQIQEWEQQKALPQLTLALAEEDRPLFRSRIVSALGEVGGEAAVGPLVAALFDPETDVRKQAVTALGKVRDRRALDPLVKVLEEDKDTGVKEKAIEVLGTLGGSGVLDPLVALSKNIKEDRKLRLAAIDTLREIGDARASQPLVDILGDKDTGIRKVAVRALGKLGDARAIPPLTTLAATDSDQAVRDEARHSLEMIKDRQSGYFSF